MLEVSSPDADGTYGVGGEITISVRQGSPAGASGLRAMQKPRVGVASGLLENVASSVIRSYEASVPRRRSSPRPRDHSPPRKSLPVHMREWYALCLFRVAQIPKYRTCARFALFKAAHWLP